MNLTNRAMELNPRTTAGIQGNKFKLEKEVSRLPEKGFKKTVTFLYQMA